MEYKIGEVVKLKDGNKAEIVATPKSFMSNGSYEVKIENGNVKVKRWVSPEEILYKIDLRHIDDINNYFEIIYDDYGVHLIPKMLEEVVISDEQDELKNISFQLNGETKHKSVTIHIGDTDVWSECNPKPEPPQEPDKYNIL